MEIRGIPCTIGYSIGFCTYAIDGHGSLFWSETGFRSFGVNVSDPDRITALVERYIDAPAKNGNGMAGKLVRWWPCYARQWRDGLGFILRHGRERATLWNQWGPDRHAEVWSCRDAQFSADLTQMCSDGIDPNDLGPPSGWKGAWPNINYDSSLRDFCS